MKKFAFLALLLLLYYIAGIVLFTFCRKLVWSAAVARNLRWTGKTKLEVTLLEQPKDTLYLKGFTDRS